MLIWASPLTVVQMNWDEWNAVWYAGMGPYCRDGHSEGGVGPLGLGLGLGPGCGR